MPQPVYILFGALFTVFTAVALGSIVLKKLTVRLDRLEFFLFSFLTGSALLSTAVFLLTAAHLARKGVFLAVGVIAIGAAYRFRSIPSPRPSAARTFFDKLFLVIYAIFGVVYFLQA